MYRWGSMIGQDSWIWLPVVVFGDTDIKFADSIPFSIRLQTEPVPPGLDRQAISLFSFLL